MSENLKVVDGRPVLRIERRAGALRAWHAHIETLAGRLRDRIAG